MKIDLGAERLLAAEREDEAIAQSDALGDDSS
jgi:hypothetical protein